MPVPTWKTEMRRLTPKVYAYVQGGGPGIANTGYSDAGIIIGDDYAMVVDTLQAPIPTNRFLAEIKKLSTKPVRHVVNTHGHSDHTSGNQFFRQAFNPAIIAHEKGRELTITMGAGNNRTGGGPTWLAAPGLATGAEVYINTPADTAIPAESLVTIYYGSMKIELHAMAPAHTTGDMVVYVPGEKVVFGGDCCMFYSGPVGGASGSGSIRLLEWILSLDVDWVVPGHGPVGTKEDVRKNLEYFTMLRDELRRRFEAGISPGAAAASMDMGEFTDWPEAEGRLIGNSLRFYQEFRGKPYDPIPQAEAAAARAEFEKGRKR